MKLLILSGLLVACTTVLCAESERQSFQLDDLQWLAGQWNGIGKAGSTKGQALSIFTKPRQGAMSWTFRWVQPEDNHIHFAFSVIEQTQDGVFYRGIHHGRDFETFEDHPWRFVLADLGPNWATFQCLEHCRAPGVRFELTPEDQLIETWGVNKPEEPPFVIKYQKNP